MSQEIQNPQDEEDDYDVIIVGAGVGDPIAVFALEYKGIKAPTQEAPLSDVTVGISLKWDKPDVRADIGKVVINKVYSRGPHIYAIPYDDQYYDVEVSNEIPVNMILSITATDSRGKHVQFGQSISLGNGKYLLPPEEVVPQYFETINALLARYIKK